MADPDELLTITEAATIMGTTIGVISMEIDRGHLHSAPVPTSRVPPKGTRRRMVYRADIEAWAARRRARLEAALARLQA